MENIMQASAIAIIAALCAATLKKQVPEFAVILGLVTGLLLVILSYPALKSIKELMMSLSRTANLAPALLNPVIKTVGISIVTKLSAEICKDANGGGIASFLECAGSVLALVVCAPLIEAVLSLLAELL